jgi:MFS family permease
MVTAVGAGTVADITEPAKRASRMGIFLLGPQLGPLLGPLIGGQFSTMDKWRWIFGFLCTSLAHEPFLHCILTVQSRHRMCPRLPPGSLLPPRDTPLPRRQRRRLRRSKLDSPPSPLPIANRRKRQVSATAPSDCEGSSQNARFRTQRHR